jgi:hypothetical protein
LRSLSLAAGSLSSSSKLKSMLASYVRFGRLRSFIEGGGSLPTVSDPRSNLEALDPVSLASSTRFRAGWDPLGIVAAAPGSGFECLVFLVGCFRTDCEGTRTLLASASLSVTVSPSMSESATTPPSSPSPVLGGGVPISGPAERTSSMRSLVDGDDKGISRRRWKGCLARIISFTLLLLLRDEVSLPRGTPSPELPKNSARPSSPTPFLIEVNLSETARGDGVSPFISAGSC